MTTCERLRQDDLLLRAEEGFLADEDRLPVREHLDSCSGCAQVRRRLEEESEALRAAASAWLEGSLGPRSSRSTARARTAWAALGVAACVLLIAGVFLLLAPGPAPVEEVLDLSLGSFAAPAAGDYAPPSFAHMLLRSDWVAEAEVLSVGPGAEAGSVDLRTRVRELFYGPGKDLPGRIDLHVRRGVSELGVDEVKVEAGDRILFLLARTKEGIRLVTWDAYSVGRRGGLVYLTTAHFKPKTFDELRGAVRRALDLRRGIEKTKWEEQAPLLTAALRSGDCVARELALGWYAQQVLGHASNDMSVLEENRDLKKPLPEVSHALAELLPPRPGALLTLGSTALWILRETGFEKMETWVSTLAVPFLAGDAFTLLRRFAAETDDAGRAALGTALRKGAGSPDPSVRYLSAGLLVLLGDRRMLLPVLDAELPKEAAERLRSWTILQSGRAWPPLEFASALAGRRFRTEEEARRWVDER